MTGEVVTTTTSVDRDVYGSSKVRHRLEAKELQ